MPDKRLLLICLLLVAVLFPSAAQDNLLTDPGFEDTNMKGVVFDEASGTTFSVNAAWNGWYATSPREQEWQNRIPNGTGRNNVGAGFVRSGNRSQELSRGQATFTAAVYQTVSVAEGTNLIGSAYYVMDLTADGNSQARVGIDPNGGNNPLDSDVVWSGWGGNQLATSGFRQLTVNATSTGPAVTLFLYTTQSVPSQQNGIFWDDASLTVGGGGSPVEEGEDGESGEEAAPPPPPPPPAEVPLVVPQGTQEDGSIVHIVQAGDTINSIAVAYGVRGSYLIELNNILQPGLIRQGQPILIQPPSDEAPAEEEDVPEAEEDTVDESETAAEPPAEDLSTGGTLNIFVRDGGTGVSLGAAIRAFSSMEDDSTGDAGGLSSPTTADEPDVTVDTGGAASEDPAPEVEEEAPVATEEVAEPVVEEEPTTDQEVTGPVVEAEESVETEEVAEEAPQPTEVAAAAPDPLANVASLCVMIYADANNDTARQPAEGSVPGGMISLQREGAEVDSFITDDSPNMSCFENLEPGQYIVDATAPDGFTLLPSSRSRPNLPAGQQVNISFAAVDSSTVPEAAAPEVVTVPEDPAADLTAQTVAEDEDEDNLLQYIGLIVFGLAGLTLVTGVVVALALRGR